MAPTQSQSTSTGSTGSAASTAHAAAPSVGQQQKAGVTPAVHTPATGESGQNKEPSLTELKAALAASQKTLADYTEQLKRLQAEFENYIKRSKREMEEVKLRASEHLLLKVADIHEDFQRGLPLLKATCKDQATIEGMELVEKNFAKLLTQEGLGAIVACGKQFDPYQHDALLFEKTATVPEGTVLMELQKGYTLHGKVIRHSKVKIAKPVDNAAAKPQQAAEHGTEKSH